jgi:hypothetical protein
MSMLANVPARTAGMSTAAPATLGPVKSRRAAAALVATVLGFALLAGCDSEGADTSCSLDACTVTFDRGADASVNILGVEAKLVGAEGDQVTLEVAGERITMTPGQAATEVGGLQVELQSADADQVVVQISR